MVNKVLEIEKPKVSAFDPLLLGLNLNKNVMNKEVDLLMREVLSFQNVKKKIVNAYKNTTYIL